MGLGIGSGRNDTPSPPILDDYGYRAMSQPVQSDDAFKALIAVANADGIIYASKGKEKEVADVSGTSSKEAEMIDNGPAVFVSVHCPVRGYGHAIFQAKECAKTEEYQPLTALYFYQSLRDSLNIQVAFINEMVDDMRPEEIRLGTARRPVYIDENDLFGRPSTGFRHLGYLEELDPGMAIKPVLDDDDKKALLKLNNLDERLDMYVLYIWTAVSMMAVNR